MNKILRFTFVAALAAVSSLSFAQKTVTIKSADLTGEKGDNVTLVKDGVTITFESADLTYNFSYRLFKGKKVTVAATSNIQKIEMQCDPFKQGAYLADGFKLVPGLTISANKENATWTGNAKSVELTPEKHQVRVKSFIITLENDHTGIKEMTNKTLNENAPIYNLAGQRVGKDYKGVVVQNGKKFIKR